MQKIQLDILGLSTNPQGSEYTLILFEVGGDRKLPILIGGFEAQAIALKLENHTMTRPFTHDLVFNMLEEFGIVIREIFIDALQEEMFFAKIICGQRGETQSIDARPSDAIAIALRANVPIYVDEDVLERAGIISMREGNEDETSVESMGLDSQENDQDSSVVRGVAELRIKLEEAIEKEDYERAAKLRDEISKLGASSD